VSFFITSWDDGYATDLRVAALLEAHDCTGTFYVCPKAQHGQAHLTAEQIRRLSERHTIGAHTMAHPWLTKIPLDEAREEIQRSKEWVEQITGKPCTAFCYPYGDHNAQVRTLVQEAGFASARTTEDLQFRSDDPFATPVSLQIMPFPLRQKFTPLWKILDPLGPLRSRFVRLRQLDTPISAMCSWSALAKHLYTQAQKVHQQFFHLYGHSREVDRLDLWNDLEEFLRFVSANR
jgi:peptidoglycan-N-acetylglucosamine deacetylase